MGGGFECNFTLELDPNKTDNSPPKFTTYSFKQYIDGPDDHSIYEDDEVVLHKGPWFVKKKGSTVDDDEDTWMWSGSDD